MRFVWITEQTAIISLYSINWPDLGAVHAVSTTPSVDTTSVRPSVCDQESATKPLARPGRHSEQQGAQQQSV